MAIVAIIFMEMFAILFMAIVTILFRKNAAIVFRIITIKNFSDLLFLTFEKNVNFDIFNYFQNDNI